MSTCGKCVGTGQLFDGSNITSCDWCNGTGQSIVEFNPIDDDNEFDD